MSRKSEPPSSVPVAASDAAPERNAKDISSASGYLRR